MREHNLVIGGGGSYGPPIFLTALLAGIKNVILIEGGSIGKGVNNRSANYASTRLIQPGLKYISSNLNTIRVDAFDCQLLKLIAGTMLEERAFILPIYKDYKLPLCEPWVWDVVLSAYDRFSKIALHPRHQRMSRREVLDLEPALRGKVAGGMMFFEWVTNPVQLARSFAAAGKQLGGIVLEQSQIVGFRQERGSINEVFVRTPNGSVEPINCHYFINACGGWAPNVAKMFGVDLKFRLTKGSTVILSKRLVRSPLVIFDDFGHYTTIIPWGETTTVGPTNYDISDEVAIDLNRLRPEQYEIEDLLNIARRFLGCSVSENDIIEVKCGVRPQLNHQGVSPYDVTHEFAIFDHVKDGVANALSVGGGKLTSLLRIAKEATEPVCKYLGTDFLWRIPFVTIGENGYLQVSDNLPQRIKLRDYRQKCALALRGNEHIEAEIFEASLFQKGRAAANLLSQIFRR